MESHCVASRENSSVAVGTMGITSVSVGRRGVAKGTVHPLKVKHTTIKNITEYLSTFTPLVSAHLLDAVIIN